MEEHNKRSEILENYLKNEKLSKAQKEVLSGFKNEIFGNMHIIGVDGKYVNIYCEETDKVYHPMIISNVHKDLLLKMPLNIRFHGSLFVANQQLYMDQTLNIDSRSKRTYDASEKLYEHIYELLLKDERMMAHCHQYTYRDLDKNKFSNIFLDYLGPLSLTTEYPEVLEDILQIAMAVWNDNIEKIDLENSYNKDLVQFLKGRKEKYFSNINRKLLKYYVDYDEDGFELITHSA